MDTPDSVTDSQTSHADIDLERRFGALSRLYGIDGAKRIRASHFVVVGLGGVGSWAAEAAARSGAARLTLIDLDHIAESNINRQVHALDPTLGQSKVQAMKDRVFLINPHCAVDCIEEFVEPANWPGILPLGENFDNQQFVVIDACDQVRAKSAMAAWAIKNGVNFISVGAAGGKRLAHLVNIEDLSLVTHDPLLAQMRYRLRKEHEAPRLGKIGVTCVFSRESVTRPTIGGLVTHPSDITGNVTHESNVQLEHTDGSLNCHGYGSTVSVTATFGMCAVSWALDKISV